MEDLPVRVNIEYLFESIDPKSRYLIDKLNAWINFQTLAANWFADESRIIDLQITLLPENHFLDLELDNQQNWQTANLANQFVFSIDSVSLKSSVYGCLKQDTIKQLMEEPQSVEGYFQDVIKSAVNLIAADFKLTSI